MFNKKTVLSTIALLTAGLIAGCTDSGSDSPGQGVGSTIFHLTANSEEGDPACFTEVINVYTDNTVVGVYEDTDPIAATINQNVDCTVVDNLIQVGLAAGNYIVPEQEIDCTYQSVNTTCTIAEQTFVVTMGGFTDILLEAVVHTVDGDVGVVAGGGIGNFSIADDPIVAMTCSAEDDEICNEGGETCWDINDTGPACYPDCTLDLIAETSTPACADGLTCVPLFDSDDSEPAMPPLGVELTVPTLPGACMNLTPST